jgi:hypothetical protein
MVNRPTFLRLVVLDPSGPEKNAIFSTFSPIFTKNYKNHKIFYKKHKTLLKVIVIYKKFRKSRKNIKKKPFLGHRKSNDVPMEGNRNPKKWHFGPFFDIFIKNLSKNKKRLLKIFKKVKSYIK